MRIKTLDSEDKFFVPKYEWDYDVINSGQLISEPIKVKYSQSYKMITTGIT